LPPVSYCFLAEAIPGGSIGMLAMGLIGLLGPYTDLLVYEGIINC